MKIIRKKDGTGFESNTYSCTMLWDEHGAYLGQYQINCLDAPGEGPDLLFFKAQGNDAGQYALSQEEMDDALDEVSDVNIV